MAYEFHTVDLSVFDFHAAVSPLLTPGAIQPSSQFLTEPAEYNKQYRSGQPLHTAHFTLQPMRWRTMTYHHFWKYYQLIHQLGAADFWKLQMPFIGHPTHTDITLVTGSTDFTGVVRPLLFLSAMGWSTNLNIRLRGHMQLSHLQDFVSLLPHKSASFFEVNGTRKTLPEVFEFFAAHVRQDVYQPNLVDTLKLKRYLVMTLSQFSGEIGFYRSPSAGVKQIPAADRALLHSILTGTTLDVPELIRREQQKKFLLTRFADPLDSTNPDFALTYFDHGSLIFMQRTALTDNYAQWKARRAAMRCHASNIRNYLTIIKSLLPVVSRQLRVTPEAVTLIRADACTAWQNISCHQANSSHTGRSWQNG